MKTSTKLEFAAVMLAAGLFSACRSGGAAEKEAPAQTDSVSAHIDHMLNHMNPLRMDVERLTLHSEALKYSFPVVKTKMQEKDYKSAGLVLAQQEACDEASDAYALELQKATQDWKSGIIKKTDSFYEKEVSFDRVCRAVLRL